MVCQTAKLIIFSAGFTYPMKYSNIFVRRWMKFTEDPKFVILQAKTYFVYTRVHKWAPVHEVSVSFLSLSKKMLG